MAIVLPFRGIRYNTDRAGDMAQLVAPPYDVVDDEINEALATMVKADRQAVVRDFWQGLF